MKKFIINILLFIPFTFVFYTTTLFFWGTFAPSILSPNINYKIGYYGHLHSRILDIKNYKDTDYLFLGSSHAYRGFDTRIFSKSGFKSFNLGSSAQSPIQTKVLLERYLDFLNPKIVIYEVYPTTLSVDGVESSLDLIANDKNDLSSLMMTFKINNIKTYNTFLFGVTNNIFGLNNSFKEPIKKGKDTYIHGGYVEKEISYNKHTKFKNKNITINTKQFQAFKEIVSIIKSKNIDLILVYAPIPKANYNSYLNNAYYDSIMNKYGAYYNFNKILSLKDRNHFYDTHHLNQFGVEIFNTKLIEILKTSRYNSVIKKE